MLRVKYTKFNLTNLNVTLATGSSVFLLSKIVFADFHCRKKIPMSCIFYKCLVIKCSECVDLFESIVTV